ncbi:MAG: DUF421 domain-containing protein [Pseudomonadota bacterium]|jgi:uncharacterized membrane protein YcaP (DUF421 family)|nr:DUF421 domain-containing protein [Sphingomonas sp.]MDQ3471318.1 DUF421 domain-containing protein [Pseudomonadota bacterium]
MTSWWIDYALVPAVALGAYVWLIFVLRLSGKRSLSKLNAFDFAITVAFGSALATIMISPDISLLRGAIVLAMLALLQYAITKLSLWSKFVRDIVRSRPTLLVEDGELFQEALHYERVTLDEIAEAIRKDGHGRLDQVAALVLETDGSFSVIEKSGEVLDLLYDVRRIGERSAHPGPPGGGDGGSSGPGEQTQRTTSEGRNE